MHVHEQHMRNTKLWIWKANMGSKITEEQQHTAPQTTVSAVHRPNTWECLLLLGPDLQPLITYEHSE